MLKSLPYIYNKIKKFTTLFKQFFLQNNCCKVYFFILFCLNSCHSNKTSHYQQLLDLEPSLKIRKDFESFLALEYLSFANRLMTLKNNKEANYFARKAIKIINGEQLLPENPLYWKSDKSLLEELIFMQRRIENITSTPYLKFNLPIQLAHLFYSYDCWVSKESRPIYKNIGNSQCRENFLRLINELEIYFNDNKKDKTQAIKLINPEFNRFFVQFDPEIAILNDAGIKNMLQIIDHLLQMSSYKIMLVGNADNSAINLKNQALMLARISIIKKYLISNGVPEYVISEHNQSEDFPDLLTINNDPVKQNRGVAIYVLKGDVNLNLYPIPLLQNLFYKQQINQLYNEL